MFGRSNSVDNGIESIKYILFKNAYPPFVIDKVIKKCLIYKFSGNQNQLKDTFDFAKRHFLCKEICKENFNIKLVFTSFKIKNYFYHKNPIPDDFKSFLVYTFTCASYSSSYIDQTCCHFKTKIAEHIKKKNNFHIFKHLHSTTTCFDSCYSPFLKIIQKVNS